jgi:AcrR family transcriptional regulator
MSVSEAPEERQRRRRTAKGKPARKKTRRTQAERTQETRARILDAAVETLRKKGYAQFRTADVAEAAGVSRGAQLHHFATKEKLVYATLEHVFHRVMETSRVRARSLKRGEDAVERIVADARDFFFSDPFFISLDIVMSITDRRFRKKILAMVRDERLPAEKAWLDALKDTGVNERLADDMLWLTLSVVRGLAIRMLWQDDPAHFDRLLGLWRSIMQDYIKQAR